MQYHIREYHSFDVKETVCWTKEDEGGKPQARAWFPERMQWYESLVSLSLSRVEAFNREDTLKRGLMIYDSTKDRWLRYHPFSASKGSSRCRTCDIVRLDVDVLCPYCGKPLVRLLIPSL